MFKHFQYELVLAGLVAGFFILPPFGGNEGGLLAQQVPLFAQYQINDYILNPAIGGTKNGFEIKSDYRYQWAGFTDAPRTYSLSLQGPLKYKNMGVGGYIFSDITGPTSRSGLNLSYSYIINLTSDMKLSMGLFGGLIQYNLDGSKIILVDIDDPGLSNNIESRIMPNASFGAYTTNGKFFAGFSAINLLQNKVEFSTDNTQLVSRMKTHLFITGGYKFKVYDFVTEPSIMIKHVSPVPVQIDISITGTSKNGLWAGLLFRTADNVIAYLAGYQHKGQILFGYAYEMTTSNLNNYSSGTHEIMIGVFFPTGTSSLSEEIPMAY